MQLVRFFEFKFWASSSFYLTCTLGVFDYYYSNCMQLEECRQGDTKILYYLATPQRIYTEAPSAPREFFAFMALIAAKDFLLSSPTA